jgi:putative DNA primase/helicase
MIDKFLIEVIGEDFKPIMYAFIGYCMLPTVKYQKAILLKGSGANGKSTLIDLIRHAVGKRNCSGVPLQEIGKRFQNARMRGKLLNAVGDISNEKIRIGGPLKDAIAENTLTSDIKHHSATSWNNTTKLIFSCNEVPLPYDETFAFFRRWFLINCPNVFIGKNKDPDMLEKITTPEELSGLLNKAIEGLNMLEEEGGFDDSYTDWVKKQWLEELHPFEDFFQEEMYIGNNYWCDKQEFIIRFNEYWKTKGYKELTASKITRKLYYEGIKQVKGSRRAPSGQEYQGMTFKDDLKKISE